MFPAASGAVLEGASSLGHAHGNVWISFRAQHRCTSSAACKFGAACTRAVTQYTIQFHVRLLWVCTLQVVVGRLEDMLQHCVPEADSNFGCSACSIC